MKLPKPDLSDPESLLFFVFLSATESRTPFTVRQAQQRGHGVKAEPLRELLRACLAENMARKYRARPGNRGRPTAYYYPTTIPTVRLEGFRLVAEPGTEPAPPPILPERLLPVASAAERARERGEEPPQAQHPEPPPHEPEPEQVPEPDLPEPAATPSPEPEPEPEQVRFSAPEPEPEQVPEPDFPEPHENPHEEQHAPQEQDKARAYALLRKVTEKSYREREFGPTSRELLRALEMQGYSAEQAKTHILNLSGFAKEGHLEGGLRLEGPLGPRNRTPEPRYSLISKAQALEPEVAEFEALRRQQLTSGDNSDPEHEA